MAASFVLLLIGVFGPLAGMDAAWLPLIAGILGGTITVARCARCGWRANLDGLPAIGRWSMRQSRFLYRGLIAGLHVLQPLARFRGRLRGLSRPRAVAPKHVTRHPWKSPMPTLRDVAASARLVTRSGTERSFWSESWVSHTTLLTELVGVLRASRPAQIVDVDAGWRPDRDFSLAIGRWGWLHVRTLVEEHEQGACLFRIRARLRPSFVGTLQGVTLAALVAGGMSASFFIYDLSVTVLVAAVAIAAIGARAAWQAMRATAVLDRAVTRVSTAAGLMKLPVSTTVETVAEPTTEPMVEVIVKPRVEPEPRRSAETTVSDFIG